MLKINSNNIEIKICASVFQVMRKYIQLGTESLEAGGILIGKENISDDNIIIKYITEPYASDKRSYNRFIRKDKKHIDIFNDVFNSSNEIYCYIGEWYTRDEDLPSYSRLDLKNWKKIMKESPGNIDHFHIIVGSKAIRIWKFGKLSKNPDLTKTIYWKDVMEFDKNYWENSYTKYSNEIESIDTDNIDNPSHYTQGKYEVIDVIEDWGLDKDFYLANVIKYIARADYKGKYEEDLKKAMFYMSRKLEKMGEGEY